MPLWAGPGVSGDLELCPSPSLCPPLPQESKGQRKVLASAEVDLARHAGPVPAQVPLRLRLKPKSVKVVQAELSLTLSGVLLREGRAT